MPCPVPPPKQGLREIRHLLECKPHPLNLPDFRLETRLRKEDDLSVSNEGLPLEEALASFERDMIRAELARNDSNLSKTAQKLGISRHALRYRMTRLQLTSDGGLDGEEKPSGE